MSTSQVQVVVAEGALDAEVALSLLKHLRVPHVPHVVNCQGNDEFWRMMPKYNEAACHLPYIYAQADLERTGCAGPLLVKQIPQKHRNLILRLAVPMVESWLLADRDAFAKFFRVSASRLPVDPDRVQDSKLEVVNIVRSSSSRHIQRGIVPKEGHSSRVGPEYQSLMSNFARDFWSPRRAAKNSSSLSRAVARLESIRSPTVDYSDNTDEK